MPFEAHTAPSACWNAYPAIQELQTVPAGKFGASGGVCRDTLRPDHHAMARRLGISGAIGRLPAWDRSPYVGAVDVKSGACLTGKRRGCGRIVFHMPGSPPITPRASSSRNTRRDRQAPSRSAPQGDDLDRSNRNRIAGEMTPSQIEEAQRLAREWSAARP